MMCCLENRLKLKKIHESALTQTFKFSGYGIAVGNPIIEVNLSDIQY